MSVGIEEVLLHSVLVDALEERVECAQFDCGEDVGCSLQDSHNEIVFEKGDELTKFLTLCA